MFSPRSIKTLVFSIYFFFQLSSHAEVSRIEILKREQISAETLDYSYEKVQGIVYFSLDPQDPANSMITDIDFCLLYTSPSPRDRG